MDDDDRGAGTAPEEWSIREVTRLTGLTSRTLRHYDAIGLLRPARVGPDGLRHYGRAELLRLQRILVLRELRLPLRAVRRVLDTEDDELTALRDHLARLRVERRRLGDLCASVARTITTLEGGGPMEVERMFEGVDHTQYRAEVAERWGEPAWRAGDTWWRGMSDTDRTRWKAEAEELARDWAAAAGAGLAADAPEAQALARRHADWLHAIPGTPGHDGPHPDRGYLLGLGEMYVADPRFAATYGGVAGATFVREALRVYADRSL